MPRLNTIALIARRAAAALVGALVVLIAFACVVMIAVAWLWHSAATPHLQLGWLLLAASFCFSLLGSLHIGFTPPLGKKLARLEELETTQLTRKSLKIALKLALYYGVPIASYFVAVRTIRLVYADGRDASDVLLPLILAAGTFAALLIPVSVVIGRGAQGLHDILSGLSVVAKGGVKEERRPLRSVAVPTIALAAVLSFLAAPLELQLLKRAGHSLRVHEDPEVRSLVLRVDSAIPQLPTECRHYIAGVEFRWWVDLTCDTSKRIAVGRELGLKGTNSLDLLGIAIRIHKYGVPVPLVSLDRNQFSEVPALTPMVSVYVFADAALYQFPETRNVVQAALLERLRQERVTRGFPVVQVRFVRMLKVAFLEVAEYDNYYWYKSQYWRETEEVDMGWQQRFRIHFFGPFSSAYISGIELN